MNDYGICLLSVIPLRSSPKEQSEMVSQLLFGETYEITDEMNGFLQVITQYDQYPGWIDRAMHHEISESAYKQFQNQKPIVQSALLMQVERTGIPPFFILPGSTLPGFDPVKNTFVVENNLYHVRQAIGVQNIKGKHNICKTAEQFLNAPYLWGGRSVFGCDCSGFIQIVFKIHGIKLQRDAYQQAEQGEKIAPLSQARSGDLAFFANSGNRIYHVGLIISPGKIIHNSGYVHIDKLDEKGIYSEQRQQYTHHLHSIRRIISTL